MKRKNKFTVEKVGNLFHIVHKQKPSPERITQLEECGHKYIGNNRFIHGGNRKS